MTLAASLSLFKVGLTGLAVVALAGFVLIHSCGTSSRAMSKRWTTFRPA